MVVSRQVNESVYLPGSPHLDEGVQALAVHLLELLLDVQHVYLCPSHHDPDEDAVRGAQTLRATVTEEVYYWATRLNSAPLWSNAACCNAFLTFMDL